VGELPAAAAYQTEYLTHPVFHDHRSETADAALPAPPVRPDYALDRGMIPLGVVHDEAQRHHRDGADHLAGVRRPAPVRAGQDAQRLCRELIGELERPGWPRSPATTRSPCSPTPGSQGEFAGLLAIRGLPPLRGDERDVCLIPSSAHGTNAASAVMAGMRSSSSRPGPRTATSTWTTCAPRSPHAETLAAIMVTYPSTHGVFEETTSPRSASSCTTPAAGLRRRRQPQRAGRLARPGRFGADVSHLNLHKTFCIPHGGGGPGVGPVAVRAHLAPYLPGPLRPKARPRRGPDGGVGPVSAAPYGSALASCPSRGPTSAMMGADGLRGDRDRDLNANYIARRLS
jgi:glycine dehydrogenase